MQVRVITQVLAPSMQYQRKARNNTKLFFGQFQQGSGGSLIQEIIEFLLVIENQKVQGIRYSEDQMEVV